MLTCFQGMFIFQFYHVFREADRRVVIEKVCRMKTGSKADYFYMSSIIVSEGLTVTPAKTICLHKLAYHFAPRYYPRCQNRAL